MVTAPVGGWSHNPPVDSRNDPAGVEDRCHALELEAQTTRIAEFQPAFVPGLLQTSEYAREYLHLPCGPLSFGADEDAVDQMVAKRMQRQQALYQHGKQVTVVMLEGALRARVVSAPKRSLTTCGWLAGVMAGSSLAPHCRRNRPPGFLARRFSRTIGPEAHAAVTVLKASSTGQPGRSQVVKRPKARAKHR